MACAFCSAAVIKRQEIYRGKYFRVLYCKEPAVYRHLILFPIRHVRFAHQLNENEIKELFELEKMIFNILQEKENCLGYNLMTNNGTAAGQSVPHAHFHFFGRFPSDKQDIFKILNSNTRKELSIKEFKNRVADLRAIFKYSIKNK